MNRAIHFFKEFLIDEEVKVITNILDWVYKDQPEAFLKLKHQTKCNLYKEQLRELIHLL